MLDRKLISDFFHSVQWGWGLLILLLAGAKQFLKMARWMIEPFKHAAIERREIKAAVNSLIEMVKGLQSDVGSNTYLTLQSLNHAPVATFRSDVTGRCVWVSRAWTALSGQTIDEARDFGWTLAIAERDKEKVYKEWVLCVEQERPFRMTYAYRVGGCEIPVECEAVPMKDARGKTYGFFGRVQPLPVVVVP